MFKFQSLDMASALQAQHVLLTQLVCTRHFSQVGKLCHDTFPHLVFKMQYKQILLNLYIVRVESL